MRNSGKSERTVGAEPAEQERSFSRRERWAVFAAAAGLAAVAAAGLGIEALSWVTFAVGWPVLVLPLLIAYAGDASLEAALGEVGARAVLAVVSFVVLLPVAWIEAIVGYAVIRAASRLLRGVRPLM